MKTIILPLLGTLLASSYGQSHYGMGGYGYGSSMGSWASGASSKKGQQPVPVQPVQTKKSQPAPPPPPPPPQQSKKSEYVPVPAPRQTKKTEYVPVQTKSTVQYVTPVSNKKSSSPASSGYGYSSFRGSSLASSSWGYGNLYESLEQREPEDDTQELDAEDENAQYIRAGGSLVETEDGHKLKVVDGEIQLEPELESDEEGEYKSLLQTEDDKRSVVNDEGVPLLYDDEEGGIRPHDPEKDDPLPLKLMPGLVKAKNGEPVVAHDKKNKKTYHLVVDNKKETIRLVKKDGKKAEKVKGKLPLTTSKGEAVTSPHSDAPLFFENGKIIEGKSQEDAARHHRSGRSSESAHEYEHEHGSRQESDRPRRGRQSESQDDRPRRGSRRSN